MLRILATALMVAFILSEFSLFSHAEERHLIDLPGDRCPAYHKSAIKSMSLQTMHALATNNKLVCSGKIEEEIIENLQTMESYGTNPGCFSDTYWYNAYQPWFRNWKRDQLSAAKSTVSIACEIVRAREADEAEAAAIEAAPVEASSSGVGWEYPREVYGPGWGCASMDAGNPTYDICKRCDATGGTFRWKVPAGITMLNPQNEFYIARCDKRGGDGGDPGSDTAAPSGSGPIMGSPPVSEPSSSGQAAGKANGSKKTRPSNSSYVNLYLCNKTADKLYVAIGGRINKDDQYATFRGWWVREPFECPEDKYVTLAKGWIYSHAETKSASWGSDKNFCVKKEQFSYKRDGTGKCTQRTAKFDELSIQSDIHTLSFSQ